jgi:putative ABC transport system ATP-binding protein
MPLLEVKDVGKTYRTASEQVTALEHICFTLESGEFIALTGKSGCGKSTLLHLCGAMDFPTSGEVVMAGVSTSNLPDRELTQLRRRNVGFIFQSFQLIHTLTAAENVELPLLLAGERDTRARATERLRWVEMDTLGGRLVHQLSGGQQQRVAIARALVHAPKLLLADEPTGNLDTATGEVVLDLLSRSAREFGVGVIMATHSAESAALADRVIRLRDGRMDQVLVSR